MELSTDAMGETGHLDPRGPGWARDAAKWPSTHTPRNPTTLFPSFSASTPETWARFNQEILQRADRERLATVKLRELIDNILRDTAEDLRLQCDAVNLALEKRCEELEDARHKLEYHLQKVGPLARPRLL